MKVPVLNAWCGVPMRTTDGGDADDCGLAVVRFDQLLHAGRIVPTYTAAAVLGVLAGSRAGFAIGARTKVRGLKVLMAAVLATVAVIYATR